MKSARGDIQQPRSRMQVLLGAKDVVVPHVRGQPRESLLGLMVRGGAVGGF